jgi:hypothetical protein
MSQRFWIILGKLDFIGLFFCGTMNLFYKTGGISFMFGGKCVGSKSSFLLI